ncbi:MAG TPA: DUF4197 domain-containing protein [Syntrophales bacterium]|jgi:hypothetical protein|nr:DUF4197 domain-containing protein [Deltaproteobacteria bacterium]HNZ35551.1 DUF4197 domain-containing protein [Syntrophales bacterium]HOF74662.1 DUF4197 domain-containing protein [Syntrophales bacterium]HOR32924.1 DUF4197 domain-containing protein [Syntrophales bacterium]
MRRIVTAACLVCFLGVPAAPAADVMDLLKSVPLPAVTGPAQDSATVASGLKEALSVGTKNAVGLLSGKDGYFANEAVKILLPENVRRLGDALRMAGYQKEVDAFVLSMNRAAEKAAPRAADIFAGAIREMSITDAQKILGGGNTAATEYFKSKTSTQLFDAFKPDISKSMSEVGVTRAYKAMTDRYTSMVPFAKVESLDLDRYVTNKSLDGLFYMVGQEETKIRTNPAARTTELLRKVFAK